MMLDYLQPVSNRWTRFPQRFHSPREDPSLKVNYETLFMV